MAAGATLAVTASQLVNATDYIQQLQALLKATEAALETANTLNATGGRWLKLFKPMLNARAHYKDALDMYALAIETIRPCIEQMNQEEALVFLASATKFLKFRKSIYEGHSYKREECIRLRKEAIVLKENADRSRAMTNVDQLHNIVMNRPITTRDASRAGTATPLPAVHTRVVAPHDAVGREPANRNPFIDHCMAPPTADPGVSGPSVQASA